MPIYDYHRLVLCLRCESDELRAINPFLFRCVGCGFTLSRSFFFTLRQKNPSGRRGKARLRLRLLRGA